MPCCGVVYGYLSLTSPPTSDFIHSQAIYLSGWQVAADNNNYNTSFPDQSLYPVDSVPTIVDAINNAFRRADEIQHSRGIEKGDPGYIDYFAPIVADAEAGFGGVLNAFQLMKAMIEKGAAGVHWEDQLASVKKCGHMGTSPFSSSNRDAFQLTYFHLYCVGAGGKVLVPTKEAIQKLVAARMAADVEGTSTLVIARTDAEAADLLTSDCDDVDKPFCTGERTPEGFYKTRPGIDQAIARALAYAPYADLLWMETATPDLAYAKVRPWWRPYTHNCILTLTLTPTPTPTLAPTPTAEIP